MATQDIDSYTLIKASLECAGAGIAIYNLDGTLHTCNDTYRKMCERFCKVPDGNLFSSGMLPPDFEQKVGHIGVNYLTYFDKEDKPHASYAGGAVNNVTINTIVIDGKAVGYNVTVKDITETQKQMHLLAVYQNTSEIVLRSMSSGLVYMKPDYTVLWKGVDAIYGPELGQKMYRVGTHCYEHFGANKPCEGCPVTKCMEQGKQYKTLFHDSSNGSVLAINVIPTVKDGAIKAYLMEIRDVTVREHALAELKSALDRAQQSDQMKTAFISNMSHEVRTPLNALTGFCELLCGEAAFDLTQEERQQYLGIILENSHNLCEMVDELILLSDLQSGNYLLKTDGTEIGEFLHQNAEAVTSRLQPGVQMKVEVDEELAHTVIETDATLLRIILNNYLVNACKFTTIGSITLAAHLKEDKAGQWISFSVTDTGCGIPESQCGSIFDSFYKVDHFKQGCGLGLTICSEAARRLNGKVYLDRTYTGGAKFIFDFPYSKSTLPTLADLV